jgi:hypothetical protein
VQEIQLLTGELTFVDECDWRWLKHFPWFGRKTKSGSVYVQCLCYGQTISMHRVILDPPDGLVVDHRNGEPLDNRRCNLRLATLEENARNHRKRVTATGSQFKGVALAKDKWRTAKKWRARIVVDSKSIHLGYFANEVDAAKAYDEAAKIHFGEFARLNF